MLQLLRRHPYLLSGAAALGTALLAAYDERRAAPSVRERLIGGTDPPGPARDELGRFRAAPPESAPASAALVLVETARRHPVLLGVGVAAAVAALGASSERVRQAVADRAGGWTEDDRDPRAPAQENPSGRLSDLPELNIALAGPPTAGLDEPAVDRAAAAH